MNTLCERGLEDCGVSKNKAKRSRCLLGNTHWR